MEPRKVGITGLGASVPDHLVTNADMAQRLQIADDWICQRTGVVQRHMCTEAEATSDLALRAAEMALTDAGVLPDQVQFIVNGTMTPDHLWPSTGSLLQGRLGAVKAGACDVNAACSGFVYALAVGTQMVRSGLYDRVLVVGADAISKFLNPQDQNTYVLFGDGAGAVLLEPLSDQDEGIIDFMLASDGNRGDILQLPAGGSRLPMSRRTLSEGLHHPIMDGYETLEFAATALMDSVNKVLAKTHYTIQDINLIVPHQANLRLFRPVAKWLGVPVEKFFINVDRYGNTVAASVPIALYEAVQQGRLTKGDLVLLTAFGAGVTWAGAVVRWSK